MEDRTEEGDQQQPATIPSSSFGSSKCLSSSYSTDDNRRTQNMPKNGGRNNERREAFAECLDGVGCGTGLYALRIEKFHNLYFSA